MLQIILWILRILGILILVILGLLLLVLLLVLFVPIRYEAEAKKKTGRFAARGCVRWFAGILRVNASYNNRGALVTLRVFGKPLKQMRFGSLSAAAAKTGQEPENVALLLPDEEPDEEPEEAAETPAAKVEEKPAEKPAAKAEEKAADANEIKRTETAPETPAAWAEEKPEENKKPEKKKLRKKEKKREKKREKKQEKDAGGDGIFAKLLRNVHRIPETITDAMNFLFGGGSDTSFGEKITELQEKAEPWLTPGMQRLYRKAVRLLLKLLCHWRPRKIKGFIRYGTGSPEMTGKLTGLAYVLLPASGDEYRLVPEFTEAKLETDTSLSGHIRIWWMALTLLKLLADRQARALIRKVRGKGGE